MKTEKEFITAMLELGAQLDKSVGGIEQSMIINDAEILYRNQFKGAFQFTSQPELKAVKTAEDILDKHLKQIDWVLDKDLPTYKNLLDAMHEYANQFSQPKEGEVDPVEFAEWISNNQFIRINDEWFSTKIHYSGCSYTTITLLKKFKSYLTGSKPDGTVFANGYTKVARGANLQGTQGFMEKRRVGSLIKTENMKLDEITNKAEMNGEINPNDEFYTPRYAIEPLLKYLKPKSIIWCPFDTEESNFVKMLREHGHDAICSHIEDGRDFFKTEFLVNFDYIISNPPYSMKAEVFERLFALGKPFAMLVGVVGLFESKKRFTMFKDNNFEIMYFDKRISYFKSYADQKPSLNPPFSSVYITKDMLPKKIMFEEITK